MALAAAGQKLLWTKAGTPPPPGNLDDGKKHWVTGAISSSFMLLLFLFKGL